MVLCFVYGSNHNSLQESCKFHRVNLHTLFRALTTHSIHGHTAVLMTHEHGRVPVYIGRLRVYTAHIHGRVYGP